MAHPGPGDQEPDARNLRFGGYQGHDNPGEIVGPYDDEERQVSTLKSHKQWVNVPQVTCPIWALSDFNGSKNLRVYLKGRNLDIPEPVVPPPGAAAAMAVPRQERYFRHYMLHHDDIPQRYGNAICGRNAGKFTHTPVVQQLAITMKEWMNAALTYAFRIGAQSPTANPVDVTIAAGAPKIIEYEASKFEGVL